MADTREPTRNARVIGKLKSIHVQQAKRRGLYGDGGGLFLQVSPRGTKSWIFRFKQGGKLRVMGLGPLHTVNLVEAREKARECRSLRLEGKDPIEERKIGRAVARLEAAKAITFKECAESYIASKKAGWRNAKHAYQWPATLTTYVYPHFGALPVQSIDVALVLKAAGADLDHKTRNRDPSTRPHRSGHRLGNGSRASQGRQSGAVAWPSREPVGEPKQGPPRGALCGPSIC